MIKIVNIGTATNKKNVKSGFYGYWFQEFSSMMSVMILIHEVECNSRLTTESRTGSDQQWKLSRKKSTSDNYTSHLQQNTHGSINNNYISSMSQMIYILNLSDALSQAKRPNHSQSGWICVRVFFKGWYLHPKSRNSVSEKTTHGQGDCWCMLFCS